MSIEDLLIPKKTVIDNPFIDIEEGLDWLELDNIPKNIIHPLRYSFLGPKKDPTLELLELFSSIDYLHFAARMLLNVELPPYQAVVLDTLWTRRLPMLIAGRGSAKSFILGVYALLKMILYPGCQIVIVGAGLRQARNVFQYMQNIWNGSPVLRDIAGWPKSRTAGPRREVDRYQFELGDSNCFGVPMGDGTKIRGLRANVIIADEMASIPAEIFNVVVQGFAVVAQDPVTKMKEAALINRLKREGLWDEKLAKLKLEQTTGNQIICAGTAFYAFNHFAKRYREWSSIIRSKGDTRKLKELFGDDDVSAKGFNWKDYAVLQIPYTALPEGMLDDGILAQAKASLSYTQFMMEYGAKFVSDSDGFYKRSILEDATTNKPIQMPDGQLVQFNAIREGQINHPYVIGVDPAADRDNAAIVILEIHPTHRRIVYCWTTNKKKYNDIKKYYSERGTQLDDDYYRYIAKKIRTLMRLFNTERILMDKHGGGTAIAEALGSRDTCDPQEQVIYEIKDPDKEKPTDFKEGLHMLQLIAATQEINSDANHGMLKDFQDKVLLFPMFNTIELAKSIELDTLNEIEFDTFEDLLNEIEELKIEITTIAATPSATLGKESFDTPSIKGENDKKGRLKKDRYSALLYANYYARNKDKNAIVQIDYRVVGGRKEDILMRKVVTKNKNMYYGPGFSKFQKSTWMTTAPKFIKRR